MTPDGTFTEYPLPAPYFNPVGITVGPDHNLWFTTPNNQAIVRVTTDGTFTPYPLPPTVQYAFFITTGPDGNLWFTDGVGPNIARMTLDGAVTVYPVSTRTQSIAAGPDGNVWFTQEATAGSRPCLQDRHQPGGCTAPIADRDHAEFHRLTESIRSTLPPLLMSLRLLGR